MMSPHLTTSHFVVVATKFQTSHFFVLAKDKITSEYFFKARDMMSRCYLPIIYVAVKSHGDELIDFTPYNTSNGSEHTCNRSIKIYKNEN